MEEQGTGNAYTGTNPVSAIADAAGKLFDLTGKIVMIATDRARNYSKLLLQQGAPTTSDPFADIKTQDENDIAQLKQLATLLLLALVIIIVAVVQKDRN